MSGLRGKTLFVTGASRGIGLAISLRAARDGARVAIAAKTTEPHPKLPGTIHTAARAVQDAGGEAIALAVDVRDEAQVRAALERTAATFGGIDIVVNNASAIALGDSQTIDMKRFDLMAQVNGRAAYMVSKLAAPYLEKATNPHILMIAPPLDLREKWFASHTAYAMAKFAMSLATLGLAGEMRSRGVAVNALWPRTTIATSAVQNMIGGESLMRASRKPDIVADAAYLVFCADARRLSGRFLIDDSWLWENGVREFDAYRVDPTVDLAADFFVPDDQPGPVSLTRSADRRGTPPRL